MSGKDIYALVLLVVLSAPIWLYLLAWACEAWVAWRTDTPLRSTSQVFDYVRGDPDELARRAHPSPRYVEKENR